VRSRTMLRYYARTIEHLLTPPKPRTHVDTEAAS
jgi:hypothetical protein